MTDEERYEEICKPQFEEIKEYVTNHIPHQIQWLTGLVLGSWISLVVLILLFK